MGSIGATRTAYVDIYGEPYHNPTQDISDGLKAFSGIISNQDIDEIDRQFYQLPTEPVKMVKIGEWVAGGRTIGSWVFADGTHADLQFSRSRNGVFYLESADGQRPKRR